MSIITNFMWLTLCIYFEARSEGMEGMIAVGHVILNRVEKRDLPIERVVKQPAQFSWTLSNDPQQRTVKDIDSLVRAAEAATKVLEERLDGKDFFGANHYFNWKRVLPPWAESMQLVKRVGDHDFYKG